VTSRAATRRRAIAWPAIRVAAVAAIAGLAAWRVDWGVLQTASWGFVVLAIGANFASVLLKGLGWKGVVDALPAVNRRTRLIDVLSPLLIGFLFNTVLAARVGEFAKALLLRRRLLRRGADVSVTAILGTVVAENLISTLAWVALVIGIGLFLPLPTYAWAASATLGAVCLSVMLVALLRSPGRPMLPRLSTGPLWARARRGVIRLWGAVRESHLGLRDPRQMAQVAAPCLASWLAQWAGIYCVLYAFGLDHVGWGGAGLLLVTITLAQAFPVLPGNVGVFQAAAVLPLTASYGVSAADALAFSIVLQVTEAVVGVAIGFLFLCAEDVRFDQLRRAAEREGATEPADELASKG
jgi:Lysylphosphatidylglycerol synthase TM region